MMKHSISFLFCLLTLFFCQAQNKQYTIKGHINGECNGMKVMIRSGGYSPRTINTAVIRDNTFEMKGQVAEPGIYMWIIDKTPEGEESNEGNWLSEWFYLENSDITFTGDVATLPTYYWNPEGEVKQSMIIRGSATEDLHESYRKSVAELREKYNKLDEEYLEKYHRPAGENVFNTTEGIRLARQLSVLSAEMDKSTLDFIRQHSESVVAYDRATFFLEGDTKFSIKQIDELVEILGKSRGDNSRMVEFKAKAERAKKTAIGVKYQDVELVDTEGKMVNLSRYIPEGKYVLLEFWASWCGPCRGEIPHLKHVYKEYKDKGFEIVSVSIDERDKDWQKALREENMSWPQLDDPKADQGPARQIYNVFGVPYCILLDKEGRIYKAGMRGAFLDAELETLLP